VELLEELQELLWRALMILRLPLLHLAMALILLLVPHQDTAATRQRLGFLYHLKAQFQPAMTIVVQNHISPQERPLIEETQQDAEEKVKLRQH
jgi:hypothetical protein